MMTIVDRALQEKRVLHERSEGGGSGDGGDGGGLSPSLLCGVLDNKSKHYIDDTSKHESIANSKIRSVAE